MLDIYLLTLALSIGIGICATVALQAVSRTERFVALFHVRGVTERPRWGGVVILAGFAITPFVASALSHHASEFFTPKSGSFLGYLAATALVFMVGFLDDVKLTSPLLRSLVFLAAALAAYAAGYRIDDVGLPWNGTVHLGVLGLFATVFWIYATTNAINWVDGREGVAVGVAVLAAVTMAQIAAHASHPTVALLLVALAGSGLGFLPFITWALAALLSTGAILLHYFDNRWLEGLVLSAVLGLVALTLLRLGYLVTIWNSHSVLWLRQRVFAPAPVREHQGEE